MDFTIQKKQGKSNTHKYQKTNLDLAREFAKLAYGEFKDFLMGIVLFGSIAREDNDESSDIDILIVLNDTTRVLTNELMETYKVITANIIDQVSPRIHVTTLKYSTFFDYARNADPIAVNVLRDGVALVDTGFFDPLQALLEMGKIRPSFESVWTYYHRAATTLHNSRWRVNRAIEDLYWAVTDASHAALMKQGVLPPTPRHIPQLVERHLVPIKVVSKDHIKTIRIFYDLYKKIQKKELKDITGQHYEKYYAMANRYLEEIERFLNK